MTWPLSFAISNVAGIRMAGATTRPKRVHVGQ